MISSLTHVFLLFIPVSLHQAENILSMDQVLRDSLRLTLWPECGWPEQLSICSFKKCDLGSRWAERSIYVHSIVGWLCGYNLYFYWFLVFFFNQFLRSIIKSPPTIVEWHISLFLYFSFYIWSCTRKFKSFVSSCMCLIDHHEMSLFAPAVLFTSACTLSSSTWAPLPFFGECLLGSHIFTPAHPCPCV